MEFCGRVAGVRSCPSSRARKGCVREAFRRGEYDRGTHAAVAGREDGCVRIYPSTFLMCFYIDELMDWCVSCRIGRCGSGRRYGHQTEQDECRGDQSGACVILPPHTVLVLSTLTLYATALRHSFLESVPSWPAPTTLAAVWTTDFPDCSLQSSRFSLSMCSAFLLD